MDDAADLPPRFNEALKEARAIVDYADEAQRHLDAGDLTAAWEVLSLSHYKVAAFEQCRDQLLKRLRELGADPARDHQGSS